jgi:polysaccharide deacetylase 2 family uncharacterized protein YibQ
MAGRLARALLLAVLGTALPLAGPSAGGGSDPQPVVAIIIDDLGNNRAEALATLALPGPLTTSFLPGTAYARPFAERAHAQGKEVMLHLPMQSIADRPLGPGGLTLDMNESEFVESLAQSLAEVPHVRGVNNHMGSLLTRHPGHMDWLMQRIARSPGLFFVDSRTTARTVAHRLAEERAVPYVARDVFLDAEPNDAAFVAAQMERLIATAQRRGSALGIGHPYPETLRVLETYLHALPGRGLRLVPVSELIEHRSRPWQASSSPSPTAPRS